MDKTEYVKKIEERLCNGQVKIRSNANDSMTVSHRASNNEMSMSARMDIKTDFTNLDADYEKVSSFVTNVSKCFAQMANDSLIIKIESL